MTAGPWLLFDVPNVCWRNYHGAARRMLAAGDGAAVTFTFFRTVRRLARHFQTARLAFAFDLGRPRRLALFPGYKVSRKARTPEEVAERERVRGDIDRIRTAYLPALGAADVLAADGFEADDCIASWCRGDPGVTVVVSTDRDLLQCCGPGSSLLTKWDEPMRQWGAADVAEAYGLGPGDWPRVKALAGDNSDGIPGVPGVGEITAVKYLRGVKVRERVLENIRLNGNLYCRNLELVRLPYPGTPAFAPSGEAVGEAGWRRLRAALGMKPMEDFV